MSDLVGPEIPPHILAKRKRKAEEEATRVAAAAATSTSPTPPSDSDAPKKRRTVGPAPPPAPLDERPTAPPDGGTRKDDDGDSSSDDDDIGPSLPVPGATEDEELAAQARLARFADPEKPTTDDSKPKRDEWMLVPPSSEDWATKVDPTKLKNRKFQTGKGAKAPAQRGAGGSGASVLWTETPEERRKRLEDEVMGVKKPATQGGGTDADDKKRAVIDREREETARRIREFNEQNRGNSLYDDHQARRPKEEDDPSKRAFDREKDIVGVRIGRAQTKEMLARAADFGSRFSSGSFL